MKYTSKLILNGTEYEFGAESGWQPGANTIAYYPLTSTSTVNDMKGGSGTKYNLSNTNVTFGTYQGVDCANFVGNGYLYNSLLTNLVMGQTRTVLGWAYNNNGNNNNTIIGNLINSGGYKGWNIAYRWNNSEQAYCFRNELLPSGGNLIPLKATNDSKWHFFCYTHDSSDNSVGYTDLTSRTGTQSVTMDGSSNFCIGANNWSGTFAGKWNGGISGIIIENKARTAQEISDYYDQTKSLYGIS